MLAVTAVNASLLVEGGVGTGGVMGWPFSGIKDLLEKVI